jgi:hypothetical protein
MADIRSISENVVQFLRDNTSQTIADSVLNPDSAEEIMVVREIGGPSRNYTDERQEVLIEFLNRATVEPTARDNSYEVYNKLREKEFNVEYGAATKTGSVAVEFVKVDTFQRPYSLGFQESYYWYTFNVNFIYFN